MTTGLDQALVEWWTATAALSDLVPADRVAAELKQVDELNDDDVDNDGHFDDCVVFQIASTPHWKTNSGRGWKSDVKLSAVSIDYDRSKAIAEAIAAAWNDTTFTGTASTVTLSIPGSPFITPSQDEPTGIWDHTVAFTMNHTGI